MLIAFMGMPSSGKSSTAQALGDLIGASVFVEPEEASWPTLIADRETVGRFTALTWFRTARVPGLFAAAAIAKTGGRAIVDSYYDKLLFQYIRDPAIDWLLPPSDPYFDAAETMARLDYKFLPNADIIVFLKWREQDWKTLLGHRGRAFDQSAGLAQYFAMQNSLENASRRAAEDLKCRVLTVVQELSSPRETAEAVQNELARS